MNVYLSQLDLDGSDRRVLATLADCAGVHRFVMTGWPQDLATGAARAEAGVLHRVETPPLSAALRILVQSRIAPDWTPALTLLGQSVNVSVKDVGKAYSAIGVGKSLRFRLRANATRKIKTGRTQGESSNGTRVPLRRVPLLSEWLCRKGTAAGFGIASLPQGDVLDLRITPEVAMIGGAGRSRGITVEPALFEGVLHVTDAAVFLDALARGIGPGKAYGCGLLSVAPAA